MSEWLIQNKELIEIFASFAVAIALIFSAIALLLNSKAFRLQKRAFQADLFHKITEEINDLYGEQKECEAKGLEAIENWYERILVSLEYYAFFVNHGYFTSDMATYYKYSIKQYLDDIKNYPSLLKHLENRENHELIELATYFDKVIKNPIPF